MDATARRSSEIHFGIAWNWEHDQDFINLLDRSCLNAGLSCYLVGGHNLQQTYLEVQNNERRFHYFLDRASDDDPRFLQLNQLLQSKGTKFINAHHHYQRSIDKANIHGELLAHGLQLPLTIILPPYDTEPNFDPRVIEPLAKPFVVKPAKGSGGFGVMVGATRPDDVMPDAGQVSQPTLPRPATHRTANPRGPSRLVPRLQRVRPDHPVLVGRYLPPLRHRHAVGRHAGERGRNSRAS